MRRRGEERGGVRVREEQNGGLRGSAGEKVMQRDLDDSAVRKGEKKSQKGPSPGSDSD